MNMSGITVCLPSCDFRQLVWRILTNFVLLITCGSCYCVYYLHQEGHGFINICLFVSFSAGLCKICFTDFHKIRWKGGTWAVEEIVRFLALIWIMSWLGLQIGGTTVLCIGRCVIQRCLIATVSRCQQLWWRYVLYRVPF